MTTSKNHSPKQHRLMLAKFRGANLWQWLTAPSANIKDSDDRRWAQTLSGIQLLAAIANIVGATVLWTSPTSSDAIPLGLQFAISAALLLIAYGFSRTHYFRWAARLSLIVLLLPPYITTFSNPPTNHAEIIPTFMWLIVPLLLGSVVFSAVGLAILSVAITLTPLLLPLVSTQVTFYDIGLVAAFLFVAAILTNLVVRYQRWLESGKLMIANRELENARFALEERSQVIETSAEVSRYLSTILDPEELVIAVVEQLKSAFNYYHAHIYLLDETGEKLVMTGGTGTVGQALLLQEHQIPVGKGIVGQTAARNKPMLVTDVNDEPTWLPNPLLPDTSAEVAVPIAQNEQLLGVLDVQNAAIGSLNQSDVELLTSIANQVAIGLQNAALFKKQQQATLLLEQEKGRVQTILETITIPVVISSIADGTVLYVNNPLSETLRMSREALVGQAMPDFYAAPADREQFLAALRQQGFIHNYELQLRRGDGDRFWSLLSARIIDYEGQSVVLTSLIDINERKVAEAHTAKLVNELTTVAQVSTVASTLLEPGLLLQQVADLTKERFGLYHAHILLLNEHENALTLMAGAGKVGRKMVEEGRHIPLAAQGSLVATAARNKKGAIRNYTSGDEGFMPHPLLAETRSEMAVPIMLGDEVLGVLDVRSEQSGYFSEADMQTHTTLAAQVAVALQNARSFARSEQAVKELQELSRRLTREGWDDYLEQQPEMLTFSYDWRQDVPATTETTNMLTQPLQIHGEAIGELQLATPESYDEDATEIVTAVAERLSTHLENLRLAEQSERDRAEAEKRSQEMAVINNIVTQISASLDLQHSLQIIVDELVSAVQVDQVRVALLQSDMNELLVIAEHFDPSRTTSALGMTIPVVGNKLTQDVMATRKMAIVEDAQNNPQTAPVHDLFRIQGIETVILIPLVVNDEVIGTIGLDLLDKRPVAEASLQLAETIVYQAATAVQNARLFEQTQAALAETEILYSYSSQLNTATNLNAVLDSAAAPGFQVGATGALLLVYDQDTSGHPKYGQIVAATSKNNISIGKQLYLPDHPLGRLSPTNGQSIVFVGDIDAADHFREEDKAVFKEMKIQAMALMFLTVGNLQLGQIMIHWNKPQTFTGADERLYGAIAQQASSVVYNRLLFNQTEEALSETAALYQANADLNTAQTFEQVLTALRQHTILGQRSIDVSLNYFNHVWDEERVPEEIEVLARWSTLPSTPPHRYRLSHFPEAETVLKSDEWFVVEDVATEERLSEKTRTFFTEQFRAKSLIYVPLVVGGQWVGFLNGVYPQKIQFSEAQIRQLSVLARQAAVSIQSIRLFEQTQAALAETEALYVGSESIVLSNSEDDILHGLIQSTMLQNLDRANIFMFDDPVEDGVPTDVTAVAVWENEGVPRTVEVGTRFLVEQVPFMTQIKPDGSLTIHDVRQDPRIDEQTRQILEGFGMRSFVLYPLVAGNLWLGMVSGQSAEPLYVDETQVRRANSLVGQAAVVLQTMILFREEQARARREQLLREIATKVRSSTDVDTIMRTAVTEIGRTLGRRSFIKLGNGHDDSGVA